ncbi:hypothetical protein SNE40_001172 [Patella caerulea]|uniref:Protein ECT2 n=1 Tax=Patella caerulea TaxID=87958 RepID=A0AAN8KBY5_PATCE
MHTIQTRCEYKNNNRTPTKSSYVASPKKLPDGKEVRVVLVGKETQENTELKTALHNVDVEIVTSDTGLDFIHDAGEYETIFVVSSFEGDVYHRLHRAEARILGPSSVIKSAQNKEAFPFSQRPLYCSSMNGLIICFTGFKKRDQLCHLVDLVHHMAGSVRKDITTKVTHLVANCTGGEKYRFAVSVGTPIMSEDWVHRVWAERDNHDMKADSDKMMSYRVKPFYECCLSFVGFTSDEQKHMEELTIENGGTYCSVGSEESTHLVVDDHAVKELPPNINLPIHVVRGEWFWGCIQMEACADESIYTFQKATLPANFSSSSNLSGSKSRKRKRLKELVAEGEQESPYLAIKRRSSEVGGVSMSPNSFLDASHTPDKSDFITESHAHNDENRTVPPTNNKISPRLQVVMELLQTEKNYVAILNTILYTFKNQVEKPDQYNGPLLSQQHSKIIFGNIPPIYDIHCKIRDRVANLVENWTEECSVGDVIIENAEALTKAYPPFVNFFEKSKETINFCDKSIPRFHAFLKVCQTKPECGRQTLTELLIRPVQRLPSVVLLLNDILKRTNSSNPDHGKLEQAINHLKEVMTHINEDKRKTENQVVMFDIINDIDNCPATLLSSHRRFINKVDVIELSDTLSGRGDPLSLFLFTDSIEICKRRTKYMNSQKSPAALRTPQKAYKHLEMVPLSSIKRVLDVEEAEDCRFAFAFISRNNSEFKDKLYSFMLDSEEVCKSEMLTTLCKNLANTLCRPDYHTLMATVKGEELNINTKELNNKIKKAVKRVSRAFSFNKTPGRLKRAISGITHGISPFVRHTPGDLKGRRLASTFDLTDSSPMSASHFDDDGDSISLGAFSLQEEGSPISNFHTPAKKLTKYMTLGPSATKKYM